MIRFFAFFYEDLFNRHTKVRNSKIRIERQILSNEVNKKVFNPAQFSWKRFRSFWSFFDVKKGKIVFNPLIYL